MLNNAVSVYAPPPPSYGSPVAGYYCWLDANNAASFTYSSGNVVSKWTDRSANALEFVQATVANQPTRSGTQNGNPTVVWDGINDALVSNLATSSWKFLNDGSPSTTFVVYKNTSLSGTLVLTLDTSAGSAGGNTGMYFGATSGVEAVGVMGAGSNQYLEAYSTPDTSYHVWSMVNDLTNGTAANRLILYKDNGTASASPSAGAGWSIPSAANPYAPLTLGNSGNQLRCLTGSIAEVLIYKSILSSTDRNTNITYLRTKWGI